MENDKIWTTDNDVIGHSNLPVNHTTNNQINGDNPHLIGVQSRFRRKYFHKTIFTILIIIIIILLIAIIILAIKEKLNAGRLCENPECLRAAANLIQCMDKTIDPCDDFYRFTCGNWADDHPRPDSATSFDWFSEKQIKILRNIRKFLQSNGTSGEPDSVKQTRNMYKACMDIETLNKLGFQPIYSYLKQFNIFQLPFILNQTSILINNSSMNYEYDWILSLVNIKKIFGADFIIGFDIIADPANRTINRLVFGTPENEFQLPFKTQFDIKFEKIKRKILTTADEDGDDSESESMKAYHLYVKTVMLRLVMNISTTPINLTDVELNIEKAANLVIKFSKTLFKFIAEAENSTSSQNSLEDILYLNIDDFQNATDRLILPKTFPIWKKYLTLLFQNIPKVQLDLSNVIILTSKSDIMYLENMVEFLSNSSIMEIELFIWWNVIEELILHTTTEMRTIYDQYRSQITHLETTTPRSLYCTSGVNQLLGFSVSYGIAHDNPNFLIDTKPKVLMMLNNIQDAFNTLVNEINWMDQKTKQSTLEKSKAMKSLIGFPEWLFNPNKLNKFYGFIKLNNKTHLENMMTILNFKMSEKLKSFNLSEKFGWATTPTNVNAFHTFQANAITIPLAILQYPFYNLGLEALNYGAIGSILGHELTHGFDDSGRMFDKEGNMRQWWSNKTIEEYLTRTTCFIKQYSNYYLPEVDDYINGELTLGENIADNGGLREAFNAYQTYVKNNGREKLLPGFEEYTHNQLLFISFGNLWCETHTKTSIKWALEDSHCPGKYRLKGVLDNSPEFFETFGCKPNSKMNPVERCRIW